MEKNELTGKDKENEVASIAELKFQQQIAKMQNTNVEFHVFAIDVDRIVLLHKILTKASARG